ncbi:MAG: ComEC/Rec2 family competence protein [Pseudomonadota bacterium]
MDALEHGDPRSRKSVAARLRRAVGRLLQFEAREERPLIFAFSMAMGAAGYLVMPMEPSWATVIALCGLALMVFLASRRIWQAPILMIAATVLIGAASGMAAGKTHATVSAGRTISAPIGPVLVEGWVAAVDPGDKGPRLRLDVHAIGGLSPDQTPRHIRLTHRTRLEVSPGRFVRCWGVLRPPPGPAIPGDYDFRRQAYFDGLHAVGYVQGRCRGGALGAPGGVNSLKLDLAAKRRRLAEHVHSTIGPESGGIAAALISGDRSFIPPEHRDALRDAGLAHLLAISGLHLGIVGGIVFALVFRILVLIEPLALRMPVKKPAAMAAIIGTAAYLVLSGASVSTQRAFVMAAVVFGAILFDRSALSFRSLAIAMIAIIILAPVSVLSPGFQMSFAATGALIAVYATWSRNRTFQTGRLARWRFAAASLVVTSLVASAATAPFAIYHFDRVSATGIIANLLAMPVVSILTAPAAALSLILWPVGLSDVGLHLFGWSLDLVLTIAIWTNGLADSPTWTPHAAMPAATLALCVAALFALCLLRGWSAVSGVAVLVFGAGYLWWSDAQTTLYWAPDGAVYVADGLAPPYRITVTDGDGLGPLKFDDPPLSQDCTGRICELAIGPATLALNGQADPLVLQVRTQQQTAGLTWPDIETGGGAALTVTPDGVISLRRVPCGDRPWAPCPKPQAP